MKRTGNARSPNKASAAAAAGAGQRTQRTLFSLGFSASSRRGSGVAGLDARDDGSSSEEEEARSGDDEEEEDDESDEGVLIYDAARSDDDENDEDKDARGNALGLIVPTTRRPKIPNIPAIPTIQDMHTPS